MRRLTADQRLDLARVICIGCVLYAVGGFLILAAVF